MSALVRITAKVLAGLFVCVFILAILDDMPRWGLNVVIFALIGIALHLWRKCDKWSIRYMQKAGYDEWSKASSEIN
jgi:hypothetical protein